MSKDLGLKTGKILLYADDQGKMGVEVFFKTRHFG